MSKEFQMQQQERRQAQAHWRRAASSDTPPAPPVKQTLLQKVANTAASAAASALVGGAVDGTAGAAGNAARTTLVAVADGGKRIQASYSSDASAAMKQILDPPPAPTPARAPLLTQQERELAEAMAKRRIGAVLQHLPPCISRADFDNACRSVKRDETRLPAAFHALPEQNRREADFLDRGIRSAYQMAHVVGSSKMTRVVFTAELTKAAAQAQWGRCREMLEQFWNDEVLGFVVDATVVATGLANQRTLFALSLLLECDDLY